jgi:hypothetical protein
MNRTILGTAIGLSAVVLLAPLAHHDTTASATTCQEDQRCWDCGTMGNKDCGTATYPVQITGSKWAGWRVTLNDGSVTIDPGWAGIQRECRTDDHPAVCLAVWATAYADLATEQAMIAGQR